MTRAQPVSKLVWKFNKMFSLSTNPPVVNSFKTSSKNCTTPISQMRNDGATKIVERFETVSETVEESVIDNNNLLLALGS